MSASNSHALSYVLDEEHGLRVPVTEIRLNDSPGGGAEPAAAGLPHCRSR